MPQPARLSTAKAALSVAVTLLAAAPCAGLSANPAAVEAWRAYQASVLSSSAIKPTAGVLSPPSHFDGLDVGPYELSVSRTDALDGSEIAFGVQRLAARPALFHLRGFLSDAECDHLIAAADALSMQPAKTAGGATRSGCDVAWVDAESDQVCSELTGVVAELLLRPEVRDPSGWGGGGGFEKLQVLKYSRGGEFKLHHDANLETPRMLTVLLYLNGKGETWFPLAETDAAAAAAAANPPSRPAALAACRGRVPGRDGLLVAPGKGDALAFYNFVDDGEGDLDRLAFHAGMPSEHEQKSVAALWYQFGDGSGGSSSAKPRHVRRS